MNIDIDRAACIGSGNCAFHAPRTFDLDDDLKAIVVDADGDGPEAVARAIEGCPTRAISLGVD